MIRYGNIEIKLLLKIKIFLRINVMNSSLVVEGAFLYIENLIIINKRVFFFRMV